MANELLRVMAVQFGYEGREDALREQLLQLLGFEVALSPGAVHTEPSWAAWQHGVGQTNAQAINSQGSLVTAAVATEGEPEAA